MIVLLSHDVDAPFKYNFIGTMIEFKKSVILLLNFKIIDSIKIFFNTLYSLITDKNPYWQFESIIELEKGYGYRSTFYFCVKRRHAKDPYYSIKNKKIKKIIKKLDKEGFEIGLHGSYLSYKNLNYLKEEKRILEKILGKGVIGIRQHFLNFNDNTSELQERAGFKYDSSYGFTKKIGYKNKKYSPFYIGKLLEIPLVVMDGNMDKMGLNEEMALSEIKKLVELARKSNYLISFNFHPRYLNPSHKFAKLYKKILAYLKGINAEVLTGKQIYEKWQSS